MRAVVCTKYGPPEGLQLTEVEKPIPKGNELLIKIHATTVTYGDATIRRMRFPIRQIFGLFMGGLGKDKILGHEFAGEVEAIGEDVTQYKVNDPVFGSTGFGGGAYAEYICIPEDGQVSAKPVNITFEEAAAVPVGANTAFYLLRKGNIQPGQKVLIYGASGSVGTYAVQLARHFGGEVTGVCSAGNAELVRSLGAVKVIDYTTEDFSKSAEQYDVIFDAVRKISAAKSKMSLKPGGIFLTTVSSTKEEQENLIFLKELIEQGELKAVIDRTYSMEEIVEAHRYVDTGHKKGNVVITVP